MIHRYFNKLNGFERYAWAMLFIGYLFKIKHWPNGSWMFALGGLSVFLAYLLPTKISKSGDLQPAKIVWTACLAYLGLRSAHVWGLLNSLDPRWILLIMFLSFGYWMIAQRKNKNAVSSNKLAYLADMLLALSSMGLLLGILFHIQHWPGAGFMEIFSLSTLTILSLSDFFRFRESSPVSDPTTP